MVIIEVIINSIESQIFFTPATNAQPRDRNSTQSTPSSAPFFKKSPTCRIAFTSLTEIPTFCVLLDVFRNSVTHQYSHFLQSFQRNNIGCCLDTLAKLL